MTASEYKRLITKVLGHGETTGDAKALADAFELVKALEEQTRIEIYDVEGREVDLLDNIGEDAMDAHGYSKRIREACERLLAKGGGDYPSTLLEVELGSMLFDAPYDFDVFCRYIESEREDDKQFYLPRRKQLYPLARSLQDLEMGRLKMLGLSLPPGVGKALANDTPILTRKGWKKHGDLIVGDEVIGMNGEFKKVVAVHPKCMLDCLVEFSNGEKIICHENHEWLVHDRARHISTEQDYIAETKRLEKRKLSSGGELGHRGHRYTVQLPHRGYVQGEEKPELFDPYTFGVWLGDGANRDPRICCAEKDRTVIDRIIRNGFVPTWQTKHKTTGVLYFDFPIRKLLRAMDMCHSRKRLPKHIPEEYLTASVEQRLQLLAGLIDTDGTLNGSKFWFKTADESLRDSFVDLLATFGWRACVRYSPPSVSTSGVHGRKGYYSISFTPDIEIPCELERKRNTEPHPQKALGFKNITRVEPVEGNCITVEGDGMYLAGKTMLPTHNTTLALFFICFTSGRHPEMQSLIGSHNVEFVRGVYDEILRILSPKGEYLWHRVFPKVSVCGTNAKDLRIDLGKRKRFQTIELVSIKSGNAGKVRATNLLYCDDLVEGIEQAMNRDRMDDLWKKYTIDLKQREQGNGPCGNGVRELHISTRWSVHDVVGRLEATYGDKPDSRFINVPVENEETGKSNFNYPHGLGYSDETIAEIKEAMDPAAYKALYLGQPIEYEGQLYPEEELRRYFDLPEEEPDAIIAVCDTKTTGSDYCVLPIAYQYGSNFFIEDVVCENYAPDVVETSVVQMLLKHKVQKAQFESNVAGGKMAQVVQQRIDEAGGRTNITTKWTQANKETKIQANAGWVKKHCVFRDNTRIKGSEWAEYRLMMKQLCGYTLAGKNRHDDVPDAFAQLALYVDNNLAAKVKINKRWF